MVKLLAEKFLILGFVDVFSSSDLVNPFPLNHFATVLQFTVKSETCKNDWSKEKRWRHWKAGSRIVYPSALLARLCMQKTFFQNLLTGNNCWLSKKHFPVSANCLFLRIVSKKFWNSWTYKIILQHCFRHFLVPAWNSMR